MVEVLYCGNGDFEVLQASLPDPFCTLSIDVCPQEPLIAVANHEVERQAKHT